MAGEDRESRKAQLALALAQGKSIREWAEANEVSRQTAYRWAREPEVRKAVESYRRRAIDRSVGQMAMGTTWVVGKMTKLARESDSDSVRLRALCALLGEMFSISKYSGLEARVAEVEEMLGQPGDADRAV